MEKRNGHRIPLRPTAPVDYEKLIQGGEAQIGPFKRLNKIGVVNRKNNIKRKKVAKKQANIYT